jgi:hypothetical protein
MALHPEFPTSPYAPLAPEHRWFPGDEEGWDVRNVTVICGLRAYAAKSNILPEQTLGRGLRRMYFGNDTVRETVSVLDVGADFSMDIEIGGETFHKEPNLLEQIACRDTWGRGADSFIAMISCFP